MTNIPTDTTVARFDIPTFVVVHAPGTQAAGGPDELAVEIQIYDEHDKDRPIRVVTQNEALMTATTAPTGATRAYGIGAKSTTTEARRLADALNNAADSVDPKPVAGGHSQSR